MLLSLELISRQICSYAAALIVDSSGRGPTIRVFIFLKSYQILSPFFYLLLCASSVNVEVCSESRMYTIYIRRCNIDYENENVCIPSMRVSF